MKLIELAGIYGYPKKWTFEAYKRWLKKNAEDPSTPGIEDFKEKVRREPGLTEFIKKEREPRGSVVDQAVSDMINFFN